MCFELDSVPPITPIAGGAEEFEYPAHRAQTTPEGVQADVRAGVEWLRDQGIGAIFTVGFCFGGRHSWLAAAGGHGLQGAVGFYGMPGGDSPSPIDSAGEMKAPILALQGGADQHITAEHNSEFDEALTAAGVEHEVVAYPGAPHSFFDRKQAEFADASEDAWNRTLAFIERYR
jgi:carboxymethylenebutenolidase